MKAILIIADPFSCPNTVRDELEAAGYCVKEAFDIDQAVSLIEADGIGAIASSASLGWHGLYGLRSPWSRLPCQDR
jgi:DNA-binding NtrC family response regulator